MRFQHSDGSAFEIPDDWWAEAGMARFTRVRKSYRPAASELHLGFPVTLVAVAAIKPLHRAVSLDFGGFERARMVRILQGFVADDAIEPIKLCPQGAASYTHRLYDGLHRFHAAVAADFKRGETEQGSRHSIGQISQIHNIRRDVSLWRQVACRAAPNEVPPRYRRPS